MKKIVIFILCFSFIIPFFSPPENPVFIDGVTIHGYDVSGLTKDQAREKLSPYLKEILKQEIILTAPENKQIWITTYQDMGIKLNLEEAIDEGLVIGNKGFIFKRWWEIIKVRKEKYNIPLKIKIEDEIAIKEIEKLTTSLVKKPKDAKLVITPDNKVTIRPDISGVGIDINRMINNLKQNIKLQGPISIKVLTREVKAKTTAQSLKELKIEFLLGQFTTWYNPRKKNRAENIRKAAQALDNFMLPPQKEFSFNAIVGPRTKEAGYNEAPIILNNRFTQGLGGGVCQVSSTLYNVLLRGNITVTERHPHSLPVHYVPKGMDAAVVYGFKDLKFINNTKGYILIKTYVGQGSLTIKLFGPKKDDNEVELLSIVEKTILPKTIVKSRPDLLTGQVIVKQHGEEGYIVRVERIIRDKNKNVLVHELLTRDYYPPVDKVIFTSSN
ncbi:MAG: hypothetical protein PWQ67_1623 [Clostridia bacterium]|jgi:vancomycin resistance protein YoaR|nr:hypothetical protein [Clostridia bacterium]MDN5323169.1 hypothetical protein [Clostridia bacterium]